MFGTYHRPDIYGDIPYVYYVEAVDPTRHTAHVA